MLRTQSGFSLIESLVTVAILGILTVMAAPSFTEYQRNTQMTTVTNELLSAFASAKSESMTTGRNITVAPLDGTAWHNGWAMFVDLNYNGALDPAEKMILSFAASPSNIIIDGNGSGKSGKSYILFDALGFSRDLSGGYSNSTLEVQRIDTSPIATYAKKRRVKIASSGRIRACKLVSDTDPECSASGI